jgi:hypothetical protein
MNARHSFWIAPVLLGLACDQARGGNESTLSAVSEGASSLASPADNRRAGGDPARLERLRATRMPPIAGPVMFDTPEADALLAALFVADNGIEWAISVAPDPRIPVLHEELRRVQGLDFEVVVAPK